MLVAIKIDLFSLRAVRELLPSLAAGEAPRPSQLAALLRRYRGRVAGGKRVDHARQGKTRRGVLWCVRAA